MRELIKTLQAQPTSDGAGVKIHRLADTQLMNPFLMLDEIRSDQADDYLAGFPEHPHRGFETITYMKTGAMRHRDHMGNEGVIRSGGVQWMKAGRGVIHSEMPEQDSGLLHGFQIWLNLPAVEKMEPAEYNDLPHATLSKDSHEQVSVISGEVTVNRGAEEVLQGPLTGRATQPVLFDVELPAHATTELKFSPKQPAQLYVYQGSMNGVGQGHLALFTPGERLQLQAGKTGGHALVLSGKPLREPVVQYGPFVMNSREEIEQALRDYSTGELV